MNKFKSFVFFLVLTIHSSVFAGEGMWLPQLLKALNEGDMQTMGMKITADDIYSLNHGSLKDAVVHFGGFCTAEIISPYGLLLTNHHCGFASIQEHTTIEKNLIKDGYWAKNYIDELPNKGLFVTFIDRIEDVSSLVLNDVADGMTMQERQSKIDKNISELRKTYTFEKYQDVMIRPFFAGNQYFAFFTATYTDIRLVGTPPESIGKFGADTDNWEWPRHTGDFSMFRIYAGKNNLPAEYSSENVPYNPKHFLPISMSGVEEGDFTMIFGFPGRTDEYLPSPAVDQVMHDLNPAKIKIRDTSLKIMDKYMRQFEVTKIKYAAKYATIANAWKKWIGESQGLEATNALEKKRKFEEEFTKRAGDNDNYNTLLQRFQFLYSDIKETAVVRDYYSEITLRNVDLLRYMSGIRKLVSVYEKNGETGYVIARDKQLSQLPDFFDDFDRAIDWEVAGKLFEIYCQEIPTQYQPKLFSKDSLKAYNNDFVKLAQSLYKASAFSLMANTEKLLKMPTSEAIAAIKSDPFYVFTDNWQNVINEEISPVYDYYRKQIDSCQSIYMKAQMELFPEKKFFPDANSTLRVSYGKVEGFKPKGKDRYEPHTYLDGVIAKYKPGDYEFDLPTKLITLNKEKNFGKYADHTGQVPVCFLGSNHTTGGNSGSPAIDAYGNLVGLNFDRVWEGTMSDINYDPSICRNIMVDARYILFIIDKFAGATNLINEMKLVYPKTK